MHSRKRTRKLVAIVVLLLLLAALSVMFINYRATKKLGFDFAVDPSAILERPEYLFSFSGPEGDALERPLGVLVDGDRVYVTDSRRGLIDVFDLDGKRVAQWKDDKVLIPLYVAKNPKDGNFYVTDRRTRSIHIFDPSGKLLRDFDPKLPPEQISRFATDDAVWVPVALDFGEDGTMYVLELLKGHRLVIFDPTGKFQRSVGDAGIVESANEAPEIFQFPNGINVQGDEVWIADSNNRRMQIFDLKGNFKKIFPSEGLPRGIDFLRGETQSKEGTSTQRFAVVDTLSQDVTLWTVAGRKLTAFGEAGVLEGQFSYPNALSIAESGRIYVADTANGRIQVWGWPRIDQPIPTPETPAQWAWCLSPLLLLLLPLLFRKRRFLATSDFVELVFEAEEADQLPGSRRRWLALEADYERIKPLEDGDVKAEELFRVTEYSESDTKALMERLELTHDVASTLAAAQRSHVFCTEDPELRRVARLLEIECYTVEEFMEKFSKKNKRG